MQYILIYNNGLLKLVIKTYPTSGANFYVVEIGGNLSLRKRGGWLTQNSHGNNYRRRKVKGNT